MMHGSRKKICSIHEKKKGEKKEEEKKTKDALSGKTHDDRLTETTNTFVCACALNDL